MIWLALLLAQAPAEPATVARGEKIFAKSCAACHGKTATGNRALRGRAISRERLEGVIRDGTPKSAGHAWKNRIAAEDLDAVIAYTAGLSAQAAAPAEPAPAAAAAGIPAQAVRGQSLFFEAAQAQCGSCHAMAGRGTAVGPDLTRLARIPPQGIAMAILSTRTQYVQAVKLKAGDTFPGMRVKQDDNSAEYYDLSATPPQLRKLERAEIDAATDNSSWKHPPSTGFTTEQLADLISYIRWASFGDRKGVAAAELQ